jgi:hypothetical protein
MDDLYHNGGTYYLLVNLLLTCFLIHSNTKRLSYFAMRFNSVGLPSPKSRSNR